MGSLVNPCFWRGKKVFITGHTGFKGSWLCLWLNHMGAEVTGYSLQPPTSPSMFNVCHVNRIVKSIIADIRDYQQLQSSMHASNCDIVIHMAAQPLVRDSYKNPVETYAINVMGTVHVLEAARSTRGIKAIVNVTTDKCYENKEWVWGYRENEALGGYDPYSSSKACSELVTSSYRQSFFSDTYIATARAGNVIGGGDWAPDRLVPDCIRAFETGRPVRIRNPHSIRPWQHVLEPLHGYLALAQELYEKGAEFANSWNFGPNDDDAKPVEWIVRQLCHNYGNEAVYQIDPGPHPHEATYLRLDCSQAKARLGWNPQWNLDQALGKVVEWFRAYYKDNKDMNDVCIQQINDYMRELR
ncbi:CDP-glucose 4,6-dehydratase [Sporomusa sp.]|uniref:CDP-glucose 4,6-dehydratase n=1 Tax=Sporomusa sp. TaxID=2078658 RepID=UPI002CE31917|nr:CDP-glucose 4,6-dehydratase [Sporomusa sp.]HWR06363.1 CDP-glucose 4,6-dehydratase [Sporomusa sp.]